MTPTSPEQPTVLSIICLVPGKIGGVEAYARELSRRLGEKGWRSVLCFLAPPSAGVKEYLDLPNVVFESLDGPAAGVTFHRQLLSMLQRYKPEVVHLHLCSVFGLYAWLARAFGVKKIFFTDHASRPEGFRGTRRSYWKRCVFRMMMAPLTRVFCVSNYVKESFDNLDLLPKERTTVIYNGVDLDRVAAGMTNATTFRTSLNIPPEAFLVVQVGQIIPEKGVPDLLKAAARVCALNRSVHFLFIGDGPCLQDYRNSVNNSELKERVYFYGPVVDPLVSGVYAAADLVCQVSRWEEAFGLVIAEAMASARPILATRCGGIPELVCDGTTGYLVDRGNSEVMATRILELAEDHSRCAALGSAGLEICRKKFDNRGNVAQLLNLYGIA